MKIKIGSVISTVLLLSGCADPYTVITWYNNTSVAIQLVDDRVDVRIEPNQAQSLSPGNADKPFVLVARGERLEYEKRLPPPRGYATWHMPWTNCDEYRFQIDEDGLIFALPPKVHFPAFRGYPQPPGFPLSPR